MSNDFIISVEGLGKKYRIQHQAERQRYVALCKTAQTTRRSPIARQCEDGYLVGILSATK